MRPELFRQRFRPKRWWQVVLVILVTVGVAAAVVVEQPWQQGSGYPVDAGSTATLERISHDPGAVRTLLDPGVGGDDDVLQALLLHGDGSERILAGATPPLRPFPSNSSIGDAIRAATDNPDSPADSRIAAAVVGILDDAPDMPSGMGQQITDMLVAFTAHGYMNTVLDPQLPAAGMYPRNLLAMVAKSGPLNNRLTTAEVGYMGYVLAWNLPDVADGVVSELRSEMGEVGMVLQVLEKGRYAQVSGGISFTAGLASAETQLMAQDADHPPTSSAEFVAQLLSSPQLAIPPDANTSTRQTPQNILDCTYAVGKAAMKLNPVLVQGEGALIMGPIESSIFN